MLLCCVNPGKNKPMIIKERMRVKGGNSLWHNDCLTGVEVPSKILASEDSHIKVTVA